MILIISSLFIGLVYYLYTSNSSNENKTKNDLKFVLTSILRAIVLYSLFSFIIAYLIVNYKEYHPHSMIGLLYPILLLFGAIFSFVLTVILIYSDVENVNKKLIYCLPLYPLLFFGVVYLILG